MLFSRVDMLNIKHKHVILVFYQNKKDTYYTLRYNTFIHMEFKKVFDMTLLVWSFFKVFK